MKKLNQKGFTLIEMIIVLLIITVLMLLIVPNISKQKSGVQAKGDAALLQLVETQVQVYQLENDSGSVPSIDTLIKEGYLKENQKVGPSGKNILIHGDGTASYQ